MPERIETRDLVMMGLTTHKLSRIVSTTKIGSAFRSPFTRFQEPAGKGEVAEEPRGEGARYAVGELLLCPYCLGQWVSAGLAAGYMVDPTVVRFITAIYSAETISDFLQLAYRAAEERA